MNKYLKMFLHRGLIFGGFGPVVIGIIYLILHKTIENFSLGGEDVFLAIISTYLLAFVHAGASVFTGIEEWGLAKSFAYHFAVLYAAYSICYLVNDWIPRSLAGFGLFTGIFIIFYLLVWAVVVISIKFASREFNKRLK
jgi:hypothetical protein